MLISYRFYILFLSYMLGIPCSVWALSYQFTTIDAPGAINTYANGINDAGQVVVTTGGQSYLLEGTTFTPIAIHGGTTHAFGINNGGQIVGTFLSDSRFGNCNPCAGGFLYDSHSGDVTLFDVPGARDTEARGINTTGQIVGFINTAPGTHGFLYGSPSFTQLDVPSASSTQAWGINSHGWIVGNFVDQSNNTHGFLYDGTHYTPIDVGQRGTLAQGINDLHQIVGWFADGVMIHGFMLDGANLVQLDVPGAHLTQAYGINNKGQIVGWFEDATGQHGFLADPVIIEPGDSDGDGVPDDADLCPDTVIPEAVPTRRLGVNRFALTDGDTIFDTRTPKGKGLKKVFTTADTAGCSCEQIIAMLCLGKGHTKFGCSIGAMTRWIEMVNP